MKYIAYCRKSSESEDRQVLSIDAQVAEIKASAAHDNIKLDEIFCESMSAKEPGRPVFQKMTAYIQKHTPIILYTWKLDRLSRNPIDGGAMQWMLQESKIQKIRTHERDYHPNDNALLMSVELGMANQFSRDLSANVKRGNLEKLRQGGWPGPAPFGYLNDKAEHTVYPDPTRTHYVVEMFKLYATGCYSFKDLEKIMYDQGLRTKGGGKVSHSIIHAICKNPFYYGVMVKKGKYYPGKHRPIITKQLFDQTQQATYSRQHTHKEKHEFIHRGFMSCEKCGCTLTATLKKGYVYYYCTNGKKICDEHKSYLREEKVDGLVADALTDLQIDGGLLERAYRARKEKVGQTTEYTELSVEHIEKQLEILRQKQAKLTDSHLNELIADDLYKDKIQALNNEQIALEKQKKDIQGNNPADPFTTLERIKTAFLTANQAKIEFLGAVEKEKRKLLENLLWNVSIGDKKIANISYKGLYELIAKTPNKGDFQVLQARSDSNREPRFWRPMFYH